MAEVSRLLMLIGAATPPGRLAAAITAAADAVRELAASVEVDIMNLADTPIDICDGRPLDGYGGRNPTGGQPDCRGGSGADRRTGLPSELSRRPEEPARHRAGRGTPGKAGRHRRDGWFRPSLSRGSIRNCAKSSAGSGRWSRRPPFTLRVRISGTASTRVGNRPQGVDRTGRHAAAVAPPPRSGPPTTRSRTPRRQMRGHRRRNPSNEGGAAQSAGPG